MSVVPVQAPQEIVAQAQAAGKPGTLEAAGQFEGMLMAYMFQHMRQTVQPSGLFGDDGMARSTYEDPLDQAVSAKAVSGGKGWGLSQILAAKWDSPTVK